MKKLIIYLRLSNDDGDEKDESNSIANQRQLIWAYIKKNRLDEAYEIVEYVDDGYTGKNLDRPGIQQALTLVRKRAVGMIIVKDFSRLARDYIVMGDFIEKIFPFMNIRFVALNNRYDSDNYKEQLPDMDVSFQNLVNDYYSEEKSVKIRAVHRMKYAHGEYLGPVAPYGYRKSWNNKNHIEVDEEAAEVVYRIHCMRFFECMSSVEIARSLNDENILIPSEYLKSKGSKVYFSTGKIKKWNVGMVDNIIHKIAYLGITVSSKSKTAETGSQKKKTNPRALWNYVEGTHSAIVPWVMWLENQKPLKTRENDKPEEEKEAPSFGTSHTLLPEGMAEQVVKGEKSPSLKSGKYVLPDELRTSPVKGMVYCANCGHKMGRGIGKKKIYYKCAYHIEEDGHCCMRGGFREDRLVEIVLAAVNQQIELISCLQEIHDKEKQQRRKIRKSCETSIKKCKNKMEVLKREKLELYEKFQAGEISQNKYLALKAKNLTSLEELKAKQGHLEQELKDSKEEENQCLALYEDKQPVSELTRELTEELIDKIILYSKEQVEIQFKYVDEIERFLHQAQNSEEKQEAAV